MRRSIELIGGTFEPWPSLDTAITRALLLEVASGELPETNAAVPAAPHGRVRPPGPGPTRLLDGRTARAHGGLRAAALGSVEDEVGTVGVADAIVDELGARYDKEEAQVEDETRHLAQALEPEHRQPALTLPEREGSGRRRGRDR